MPVRHSKSSKTTIQESIRWYTENRPAYEQLSGKTKTILEEIISDQKIPIHAIYCRTKEIPSFEKKIDNLKYDDPQNQVKDLSGLRIITYVESDLSRVCRVLEDNFDVDPQNSMDKSKSLGTDKVGYRSIHYVCKLSKARLNLPEFKKYTDMSFEIQVRTILQHAWAEIEHDKDYKFSGELPEHLKRRFKVVAGVLELADREFNNLATEIDEYAVTVGLNTQKGNLDILIDSTSIKSYMDVKFETLVKAGAAPTFFDEKRETAVLSELKLFGIETLKDLDTIVPEDYAERVFEHEDFNSEHRPTFLGTLRDIMIIADAKKYFTKSWKKNWVGTTKSSIALINSYGVPFQEYIQKYDLDVIDS